MYEATTESIRIRVEPAYIEDRSSPGDSYYFWAYTILVENLGQETVQLVSRHWRIADANGHVEEVNGLGVVGEQPELESGQSFEYTSGVPLRTSNGIMAGSYRMRRQAGGMFDVEIPAFSLDIPSAPRALN